MIKERISLSGNLKSKVKQLMIYAGWYEGRKVDISIASQYYAERGVPMMKSTQRFYHKYFGLCCQWYFSGGMKRAADFAGTMAHARCRCSICSNNAILSMDTFVSAAGPNQ